MTSNMHQVERPIRVTLGIGLIAAGAWLSMTTLWGVGLIAVGLIPLATGAVGSCPAYSLLGVSTAPKNEAA